MSDLKFACPHCDQPLEVPEELLGQILDCPSCKGSIHLPEPEQTSPPPNLPVKKIAVSQQQPFVQMPPPSSTDKATRPCPYCSEDILSTAKKCKHCNEFLDTEMRKQAQRKKGRRIMPILFGVTIFIAIACGVGYIVLRRMNETVQQQAAAKLQATQNAKTKYQQDLADIVDRIRATTTKCLGMCDTYERTWLKGDGDITSRIRAQQAKFENSGDNDTIKISKTQIEKIMSNLSAPPDSLKEVHLRVLELYGVYSQIHECAADPSGSLLNYSRLINDLQSKYTKVASELKIMLPK